MKPEEFKKIDDEMMKATAPLRDRKLNPKLLEGFAVSVERRIEAGRAAAPKHSPMSLRAWVPAFAVLVLAVVAVSKISGPAPHAVATAPSVMELAQNGTEVSLAEEIEALRELGVWTDDDEAAAGVAAEDLEEFLA